MGLRQSLERAQTADTVGTQRLAIENLILEASSPEEGLFFYQTAPYNPVTRCQRVCQMSAHTWVMPEIRDIFSHSLRQNPNRKIGPVLTWLSVEQWELAYNLDNDFMAGGQVRVFPSEQSFKASFLQGTAKISESPATLCVRDVLRSVDYDGLLTMLGIFENPKV